MFGLGAIEIVLILVVLIIFVRPDDWPKVLRIIGRWTGKLQRLYWQVQHEGDKFKRQLELETKEFYEPSELETAIKTKKKTSLIKKRGVKKSSVSKEGNINKKKVIRSKSK